jgi:hypothetical protein
VSASSSHEAIRRSRVSRSRRSPLASRAAMASRSRTRARAESQRLARCSTARSSTTRFPGSGDPRPQGLGDGGHVLVAGLRGDRRLQDGRAGVFDVAQIQHRHLGQRGVQATAELVPGFLRVRGEPLEPPPRRVVDRKAVRDLPGQRRQRAQHLVDRLAEDDPRDLPPDRPGLPVVSRASQRRRGRAVVPRGQQRIAASGTNSSKPQRRCRPTTGHSADASGTRTTGSSSYDR